MCYVNTCLTDSEGEGCVCYVMAACNAKRVAATAANCGKRCRCGKMGRSEVGTDVRTSVGLFQGRFGDFTPSEGVGRWRGFETPSEGERKMRESASPSEGGKGLLGGGTRQYGALAAVLRLLTFGR